MTVFSQFSNCTFHLKKFIGIYSDGDNEIPQTEDTELRAMVNPKADKSYTITTYPGLNPALSKFQGYITESIPDGVVTPQECKCVFDTGQTFDLVLYLPPPSPFYDEISLLGTPFLLQDK